MIVAERAGDHTPYERDTRRGLRAAYACLVATRTGDQAIDQAIAQFIDYGLRDSYLRSCAEGAPGGCQDMTDLFQRRLSRELPDGYTVGWVALLDPETHDMSHYPQAHTFDSYGYGDRGPGQPQHHMTEITTPDGDRFTIDFAGVQYGYLDFPLVVQRQAADGSWIRDPDRVELSASSPPQLSDLKIGGRLTQPASEKRPLLGRLLSF
jgi:hypothetical protein